MAGQRGTDLVTLSSPLAHRDGRKIRTVYIKMSVNQLYIRARAVTTRKNENRAQEGGP